VGVVPEVNEFADLSVIYRLKVRAPTPVKYNYLVVSENVDDISRIDILTLRDFHRVKDRLKRKSKVGAGLEITIEHARKMDARCAARWVADALALYEFCQSSGFQFILSSGADAPTAAVSGECFDAILKLIGIKPRKYWMELATWLESRLERRVQLC
jgi:hypothetical protein